MAITPIRQNPTPEQNALTLVGETVKANKGPGIDESASVMNAPRAFSVSAPPSTQATGLGRNLDVRA